jgi:alpha-1,3-rhamnosyl/mannosyltransferase
MRIGFGVTGLGRDLSSGRMDGIGVYAQALWNAYKQSKQEVVPYFFGKGPGEEVFESTRRLLGLPYSGGAAISYLTRMPYPGSRNVRREIDIFHAPDHRIPKLFGVPVVATIHDAIPLLHPEWLSPNLRRIKQAVFKQTGHWANHVITISRHSAEDLVYAFGLDPNQITVVSQAVEQVFFDRLTSEETNQVLAKYGLRAGFYIFVGTLQPRKNVERIIQAHRQLPSSLRQERPLVIVGRNGWETENLLPNLEKLESSGDGKWLRYVPRSDLFALLQSAGAMVFPSLYEGFGFPVLEGFASQIPVIASNTTSLPEVAGDAALLVDPLSSESIADAMRKVSEDSELAQRLVQLGNERVKQFSWEKCANETLAVYRKVLANSK